MRLTVLGSGTFQPTPERGCSGYLIEIGDEKILLDAGSGILRQLSKINVSAEDIDIIVFTHLHIDHTGDLAPLLFAKHHIIKSNKKDLLLFGPPGFQKFFSQLNAIYNKSIQAEDYVLTIQECTENGFNFKDFSIAFLPVMHTDNSYGIRIEDTNGRTLAYSGDTDYCDNLIALCRKSDIAIIECSFQDDQKFPGHMTPSEVGKAAHLAECKRILLTHIYPVADVEKLLSSCSIYYHGTIEIAEELKTITIN